MNCLPDVQLKNEDDLPMSPPPLIRQKRYCEVTQTLKTKITNRLLSTLKKIINIFGIHSSFASEIKSLLTIWNVSAGQTFEHDITQNEIHYNSRISLQAVHQLNEILEMLEKNPHLNFLLEKDLQIFKKRIQHIISNLS